MIKITFAKIIVTTTLLATAFVAPAYSKVMVVHSQTASAANCPSNSDTVLWRGYSLFALFSDGGRRSAQKLGSTGSCSRNFYQLPFIECSRSGCDYATGHDYSLWLVSKRYSNEGGTSDRTKLLEKISRCVVCDTDKEVLVRHSFTSTPPNCPTGWTSAWDGYSFGGANIWKKHDSGQNLGDTGSCLKHFVPDPTIRCWYNDCQYGRDTNNLYQMWMISKDNYTDRTYTYNHETPDNNAPRVGRCRVCTKTEQ